MAALMRKGVVADSSRDRGSGGQLRYLETGRNGGETVGASRRRSHMRSARRRRQRSNDDLETTGDSAGSEKRIATSRRQGGSRPLRRRRLEAGERASGGPQSRRTGRRRWNKVVAELGSCNGDSEKILPKQAFLHLEVCKLLETLGKIPPRTQHHRTEAPWSASTVVG
ncbi:hypothetical protein CFC21_060072 [Triticum aestivum]|uniref:Uncharacterized protein n=2 Tax=Triticum aestivum TaxID=4565 RepID=A0A9R1E186_WHEAT|nr:hypothetical protein CFC21_017506 [Triticum aestivum]KAF7051882.1 hypothetical protein CFC21_060072 [Triticum aestivum]